jgi:asparagine synthase (glutamine-hydrolysing)
MALTAARTTFAAWQGWIRAGSGFAADERFSPGRFESGAAVFALPEQSEAKTTTWTHSQRQFCICTGYLHNRAELADELTGQVPEAGPRPATPAELVLAGYRKWGPDVLAKLEGVFAVAIWDQPARALLCGRDPMGLHPFFYSSAGEELVFSWDAETVRRHPSVPKDINRVVLTEDLLHRWLDREETHFVGVRRLPSAHGLRFQDGRLHVFCYWDPLPVGRPVRWVGREELAEFPRLLQRAVKRTMQFGHAGIFLSGGFDSISIAAWASEIAARQGKPAPKAFCLDFPGEHSEIDVQRKVAEVLGLPYTFRRMQHYEEGRGLLGRLLDHSALYPWPPMNVFSPAYSDLMALARSQGCDLVLTGEGGDEWLTVSPLYAADLIRSGNWLELARLARTILRCWKLPVLPALRSVLWTCGLRTVARDWVWRRAPGLALRRRRQLRARAMPDWVAPDPALRRELEERFERWETATCPDSFYLMAGREAFSHPLLAACFDETFYRDSIAGIPSFHPYWDRTLVDFLLRTPPELLNSGGRSKALVRKALHKQFPQLGFERQKKVMVSRFNADIYRRQGPLLWHELGEAKALADLGVVDLQPFHAMLQDCARSDALPVVHRIWHGANLEAWARSHG